MEGVLFFKCGLLGKRNRTIDHIDYGSEGDRREACGHPTRGGAACRLGKIADYTA
jgi:hypothetical protein